MERDRFVSLNENYENQRYIGFRRRINNMNRNFDYNNDNTISSNISKTKIILLLVMTIILSLSNYFYNWNNNISIIADEPRTILSIFDNNIFKINPPLNDQKKISQIRNLKEEKNEGSNLSINTSDNNNKSKFDDYDEFDRFSRYSLLKDYEMKKKIFNKLDKYYYKFNWTSIKTKNDFSSLYKIGDSFEGEGIFKIEKKSKLISDFIHITMKAYELSFIDNWIIFASHINLEDLSINYEEIKNANSFEINGIFSTTFFKGEFFEIVNEDEPKYCQTLYKLKFPYEIQKPNIKNKNYSLLLENLDNIGNIFINLNNFTMFIESSCGFKFEIKAAIYDNIIEDKNIENKINKYCLITGLSGLFYVFGIYSIIYNIKKSENVISVISSDCLLINPIWNTYIA